jgi:hypothetical protein
MHSCVYLTKLHVHDSLPHIHSQQSLLARYILLSSATSYPVKICVVMDDIDWLAMFSNEVSVRIPSLHLLSYISEEMEILIIW